MGLSVHDVLVTANFVLSHPRYLLITLLSPWTTFSVFVLQGLLERLEVYPTGVI